MRRARGVAELCGARGELVMLPALNIQGTAKLARRVFQNRSAFFLAAFQLATLNKFLTDNRKLCPSLVVNHGQRMSARMRSIRQ
jgi:hypothetical protein